MLPTSSTVNELPPLQKANQPGSNAGFDHNAGEVGGIKGKREAWRQTNETRITSPRDGEGAGGETGKEKEKNMTDLVAEIASKCRVIANLPEAGSSIRAEARIAASEMELECRRHEEALRGILARLNHDAWMAVDKTFSEEEIKAAAEELRRYRLHMDVHCRVGTASELQMQANTECLLREGITQLQRANAELREFVKACSKHCTCEFHNRTGDHHPSCIIAQARKLLGQ